MRKPLYPTGAIATAISDGIRDQKYYRARVRWIAEQGLIQPESGGDGEHLRFDFKAVAAVAIFSEMLDMGLSHVPPGRPMKGKAMGADDSPFEAVKFEMMSHHRPKGTKAKAGEIARDNPNKLQRAMQGVANGDQWFLRIDLLRDTKTGRRRWVAAAYPAVAPEAPFVPVAPSENAASSVLITLNPLLLPIVTDRSGMN